MKVSNLDHTADAGVEIIADTLEELFLAAANGMYRIMNCPGMGTASGSKTLRLKEEQLDILLVSFLSELNYYISAHYLMLDPIEQLRIKQENGVYILHCKACQKTVPQKLLEDLVEIKAVTYHQLEIKRQNDGYHTKIIFDL